MVLNWAAPMTMTSNNLIIRASALQSESWGFVLGASAQEERSQLYYSCAG
jgi:hypothetical protein